MKALLLCVLFLLLAWFSAARGWPTMNFICIFLAGMYANDFERSIWGKGSNPPKSSDSSGEVKP